MFIVVLAGMPIGTWFSRSTRLWPCAPATCIVRRKTIARLIWLIEYSAVHCLLLHSSVSSYHVAELLEDDVLRVASKENGLSRDHVSIALSVLNLVAR